MLFAHDRRIEPSGPSWRSDDLAAVAKPPHIMSRFMAKPTLPAGHLALLPGLQLRLPLGPLAGASRLATLGRIGSLEARLARTVGEVKAAQSLRYRVFYQEMSAVSDEQTRLRRRDADEFDAICDHIVVIDHAAAATGRFGQKRSPIVGTYRVLRQDATRRHGEFYASGEFDILPLLARHPGLRFLELGRSCVLPAYRSKRTVELLWQGVWAYVLLHRIDVMFGCASLAGTDPARLAMPLSFLHHNARSPAEWLVRAQADRRVDVSQFAHDAIDARHALQALPPLIKGYLRLGASIGDGAVIDHQFGTTDVFMVLPVAGISPRYIGFYGADAGRRMGAGTTKSGADQPELT
jgi:putative hemolysin